MATFIIGHRPNAARIPDDVWEKFKPILVEKYEIMTVLELKDWMEREHNFSATKRQYVHRFLHVWKLKKYKQNTTTRRPAPYMPPVDVPSPHSDAATGGEHEFGNHTLRHEPSAPCLAVIQLPVQTVTVTALFPSAPTTTASPLRDTRAWVPQLNSGDVTRRHAWLADILFALGDSHYSFVINSALWDSGPWNVHTVACVRSAQSQAHVQLAQRLARADADVSSKDGGSWASMLPELLLEHICNWDTDAKNGLEQTENMVRGIIFNDGQGRHRLKTLSPRGPHLDIPTYTFLRSTLTRYNSEHGGGEIDIQGVLKQFLDQQPAFLCGLETDPLLGINCLTTCLKWCMEALHRNATVPPGIRSTVESSATGTYTVLCTLWQLWMGRHLFSPSSDIATRLRSETWEDNSNPQLGISATELLSTVVCMIMAVVPKQDTIYDESILVRALAGANALDTLSSEDLIHHFLNQVWATNRQLVALPSEEQKSHLVTSGINAAALEPFRRFVAQCLNIHDLPMLEQGAVVYPIVLAELERPTSQNPSTPAIILRDDARRG